MRRSGRERSGWPRWSRTCCSSRGWTRVGRSATSGSTCGLLVADAVADARAVEPSRPVADIRARADRHGRRGPAAPGSWQPVRERARAHADPNAGGGPPRLGDGPAELEVVDHGPGSRRSTPSRCSTASTVRIRALAGPRWERPRAGDRGVGRGGARRRGRPSPDAGRRRDLRGDPPGRRSGRPGAGGRGTEPGRGGARRARRSGAGLSRRTRTRVGRSSAIPGRAAFCLLLRPGPGRSRLAAPHAQLAQLVQRELAVIEELVEVAKRVVRGQLRELVRRSMTPSAGSRGSAGEGPSAASALRLEAARSASRSVLSRAVMASACAWSRVPSATRSLSTLSRSGPRGLGAPPWLDGAWPRGGRGRGVRGRARRRVGLRQDGARADDQKGCTQTESEELAHRDLRAT